MISIRVNDIQIFMGQRQRLNNQLCPSIRTNVCVCVRDHNPMLLPNQSPLSSIDFLTNQLYSSLAQLITFFKSFLLVLKLLGLFVLLFLAFRLICYKNAHFVMLKSNFISWKMISLFAAGGKDSDTHLPTPVPTRHNQPAKYQ